jgi:hypothetical protein
MNPRTIVMGQRIIAQLVFHTDRSHDVIEFHAFFDENLSIKEREIVLRNYLNELMKDG